MTEAEATTACGPLDETNSLPADQVAALKLADALTEDGQPHVSPELMGELSQHFTEPQILELGAALAVASGWQRMIEAFGIRPDHWSEATPSVPRPGD